MKWVLSNLDTIGEDTLSHLAIALPPIIIAFLLSIPIGWLVVRLQRPGGSRFAAGVGSGIVTVAGLLYAIPSLALFVALPSIIGTDLLDPLNVVISLTLYGLALMVRSTVDGLTSVDAGTKAASTAMGYSSAQRFFRVELPLAGPVLLAGLRVVSVSTISLTTVGAVLGIQSLGSLFTDGLARGIYEEIISGIVMVLVLAFALDGLLVLLGRVAMPWNRRTTRTQRASRRVLQQAEVTS
ncbi:MULTISPECIES: ABC transporter permease [unclassified Curtobacterium]|uniref:ABC transporter permease n=1 Tax=unclassified Curtobacterium TaxID=257496 RepID=UPI0008DE624D|nr:MULTISPECIES: ABC transporter permease [unclassified Curtobacterium]OIH94925.1 ABC transporter permease [Curtobacterium sp. MCBA15_003]OII12969.1 ABC transporter permease [Curtobacterium sp. MCBA15_009]OII32086.1 ABC transporter permease [Curtobacterium sp. MMLR14_006]